MPGHRSSSATVCSTCTGSPRLSIGSSYTYQAPSVTAKQVSGVPCAVGQNRVFTLLNRGYVAHHGGFSACSRTSPGRRSLTICAQVVNRINRKDVWFRISGS